MITSCLSYPGSKRKAYDLIDSLLPDKITSWREPFFGSGSVTFGFLQSEKSRHCKEFIVGDLYSETYNFWAECQRSTKEVYQAVLHKMNTELPKLLAYRKAINERVLTKDEEFLMVEGVKEEMKQFYNTFWNLKDITTYGSPVERAARFFIVSKVSFSATIDSSGSCSTQRLLSFDVDAVKRILEMEELLKPLQILNADFRETMKGTPEDGGFIFLDPPYYNQEGSALYGFKGSTHKGFPHREFINFTREQKANWLVTYDDSVYVRRGFNGFFMKPFELVYTMAGDKKAKDALAGEELFIANYDICSESDPEEMLDLF